MTIDRSHFGTLNGSEDLTYYWGECQAFYEDGSPAAGFTFLQITLGFEFLLGGPSNLWLVRHIFSRRSKAAGFRPADFFPLHLALVHVPFFLSLPLRGVNNVVWRSDLVLNLLLLPMGMIIIMKPLLLCLVCVERYMAVVRPITYLRFKTPKYRWGCVAALWCIYVLKVLSTKRDSMSVCLVLLPVLAVDTFCCLSVLKVLKKPPPGDQTAVEGKKKEAEEGRKTSDNKGEKGCLKKKAFITIAIIQAVLTLNYLPFIICWAVEDLMSLRVLKCHFTALALAAATSCTYLQPLLYLHRLGRLRCSVAQKS